MLRSKQRIVLVEDNPGDAFLACERLNESPASALQVDVVTSLAQCLELLARERADAIVLDLSLPDSQGIDTLRQVRAAAADAPIIVVSGHVDDRLREQVLAEGAEDVFSKTETDSRLFSRSVLYVVERNRARLQHARLQALLDAMPDAIVVADASGSVLFANPAARELFGHRQADLLADPFDFLDTGGEAVELSIDFDGSARACEMRVVAIEWDGEPAQLASVRDMTQRNQADQLRARSAELELRNHRIEQASRLKSEFLANMSHEIRTPMNAVIGLSYLLERTSMDAVQAGYVDKIKLAGKALLSIISNVLDVSKIEAGELSIERAPISLDRLLQDLASLLGVQAANKGVDFSLQVSQELPPVVEGDATRLHQVLANLLSNAIKFTERGSVALCVHTVSASADSTRVRFIASDTGIGIAPQALAQLFNPFVQADASTTRRFGGTGLGLSIVKQLTTLMGGTFGVSSKPRVGSDFWVELDFPICRVASPSELAPLDPSASEPRLTGVRVLVADDNEINLEVARRILELEGASVRLASNGQEAVQVLLSGPDRIDVVLMDVQMPVLDGHDATRRIRGALGLTALPIIALTAGALTSERQLAQAAGMNDFLTKPFDPQALVRCVRRHAPAGAGRDADPVPRSAPPVGADWPVIAGIDAGEAFNRLGGDNRLFRLLLNRLLEGRADLAGMARRADDPEVLAALARRLHDIKGSAGTLGAREIMRTAADTEVACREGRASDAALQTRQLVEELEGLHRRSVGLLEAPATPDPSADDAAVRPLQPDDLPQLLHLLRTFNFEATKRFERLAPQLRRVLGRNAFATVEQHIDTLRFDEAAQHLAREFTAL